MKDERHKKYKQVWMRLNDYKIIRKSFKAKKGETALDYFTRLAEYVRSD